MEETYLNKGSSRKDGNVGELHDECVCLCKGLRKEV